MDPKGHSAATNKPTDLRGYRRETDRRLLFAVILILVAVGGGLILLIYGPSALLAGLPCLLGGVGVITILHLMLTLVERWAKDD